MENLKLFNNKDECRSFKPEGGSIDYYPNLFSIEESDIFFDYLLDNIKWQQDKIFIFGKSINLPRLTAWYGDPSKSYTYSGIKMNPLPWTKQLTEIKTRIEKISNTSFNSVLLNHYRDGNDHVSWHADDEPELGDCINIGSVNFGATREFKLKHKKNKKLKSFGIELEHGSYLLMKHPTQLNWLHQLPKRPKIKKSRVNLTFRKIIF